MQNSRSYRKRSVRMIICEMLWCAKTTGKSAQIQVPFCRRSTSRAHKTCLCIYTYVYCGRIIANKKRHGTRTARGFNHDGYTRGRFTYAVSLKGKKLAAPSALQSASRRFFPPVWRPGVCPTSSVGEIITCFVYDGRRLWRRRRRKKVNKPHDRRGKANIKDETDAALFTSKRIKTCLRCSRSSCLTD